jgi:hypothetical protein
MFWIGLISGIFIGANVGLFTSALLISAKKKNEEEIIRRNINHALSKDQIYNMPPCSAEVCTC